MMENNKSESGQFQQVIKTKHVFIDNQKVFIRSEEEELSLHDVAEWFPTDFNWAPVRL